VGIDWSYALCRDANRAIDGGSFVQGDLLQLPLADHSVGSIISLGAVEHSPEGPSRALAEYARVLRPGGVAVVTVPYLGPARRLARLASWPRARMRTSPAVRRLARKPPVAGTTAAEARRGTRPGWAADYTVGPDGWAFYQYQLTKAQMRACIASAGLGVEREFVEFHDEGVLHTFGRLAGRWDARRQAPRLHPLGQLLSRIMPVGLVGHMLCYVVRPDAGRSCRVG
jgi:SAM-dependent methyltransferase